MRKYHLFITMCGRKLADPWTVHRRGMHKNVCASCARAARSQGQNPRRFSPIEDRSCVAAASGLGCRP